MTDALTYRCLLCGVDHPIIDGRVEHTVFAAATRPTHTDLMIPPEVIAAMDVPAHIPEYTLTLYCPTCGARVTYVEPLVGDPSGRHFMCERDHEWTASLPERDI